MATVRMCDNTGWSAAESVVRRKETSSTYSVTGTLTSKYIFIFLTLLCVCTVYVVCNEHDALHVYIIIETGVGI